MIFDEARMHEVAEIRRREAGALDDAARLSNHPFVKTAVSATAEIPNIDNETTRGYLGHVLPIIADDPDTAAHQALRPPHAA